MNFFKKIRNFEPKNVDVQSINYKKYLAEIFLAVGVMSLVLIIPLTSKAYATEEYWALNVGDKTIAVLSSESDANSVIEQVKARYTEEGAKDVSVSVDPVMSTEQKFYKVDNLPEVLTVEAAVDYVLTGTNTTTEYTVKANDTLWTIASMNGITLDELLAMNSGRDISVIKPGDQLSLTAMKPFVTVTTTQTVTSSEEIPYDSVTEESSSLSAGTTEVKTPGENGAQDVTKSVVTVNGQVSSATVLTTTITKNPVSEVVVKGTKVVATAARTTSAYSNTGGAVYSGNGQSVASYALQFVGNPYVLGGESLTNGADCSGFVKAAYARFGIGLPHSASAMRSYGRSVTLSEARAGDIVCYYGHVGIYIGNGRIVHARNPRYGICTDSVYLIGNIVTIRRLVE